MGSKLKGKKKILVLSIIEFVIHGALLGLAAYFAFDMIEGVLEQANINLVVGGIGLQFGYNTLTDLIDDSNIVESILLGIQLGLIIPLALGTCASLFGLFGVCCGKTGRCCFVMHSITASILAFLYCILMLASIAGLAVVNSDVLQDGMKNVLDEIDLASVAGKSAGSFQNGLLDRNDVILIEPKQLDLADMDLEAILEEYSFVQNVDIEALDEVLTNVDLSDLSFEEFDPKDQAQLEELGQVLEGVDLESVVEDLTSNALENLDVAQVIEDSGIKKGLNMVLGIATGIFALLFALMVSSCVIACGTKTRKVRSA